MSDPTLIADLARAGLAPELLQRVVLELARAQAEREAAERRRALDRARKAFQTGSDPPQNSEENAEFTGTVGIPTVPPSRARPLLTSLKHNEIKEVRKKERGRSLPDDWRPNETHYAKAAYRGRAWVDHHAASMRDWAIANRHREIARKTDWDRTFNGWLDRELAKPGGQTNGQDHSTTAVARRLAAEFREQEERAAMGPVLDLNPR